MLAHELGHHAAEQDDPSHPDYSEDAADRFKDVYMKRGKQTRKIWDSITKLPINSRKSPMLETLSGGVNGE